MNGYVGGAANGVYSGCNHPRWKGGAYIRKDGYVCISAGIHRGKLEHRLIMEQQYSIYPGGTLPYNMEVHHIDYNKSHNCPSNLMLLDSTIHAHLSARTAEIKENPSVLNHTLEFGDASFDFGSNSEYPVSCKS